LSFQKAEEEKEKGGNRWINKIKKVITAYVLVNRNIGSRWTNTTKARASPKNEYEEEYDRKKREDRNKDDVQREQEMAE